ncbi:hypothetical protein [Nocardia sp. NPDC052566]|uniref:hypothetical protein n=1 Tax=Nocardia sp. NPDC052566 TaxID=3364330 RepID=UPI0037CA440B
MISAESVAHGRQLLAAMKTEPSERTRDDLLAWVGQQLPILLDYNEIFAAQQKLTNTDYVECLASAEHEFMNHFRVHPRYWSTVSDAEREEWRHIARRWVTVLTDRDMLPATAATPSARCDMGNQ